MEAQEGIYLTIRLGKEIYGIPVLKVQEIIGKVEITQVPRMPEFIKGVINLRGKIIPLMDLRLKFGLEEKAYTDRTVFIVLEVFLNEETRKEIGVVVDAATAVAEISAEEIEPPPRYGVDVDYDFIVGMAKQEDKVIMVLDIEQVLTEREMAFITEKTKGEAE